MPRSSSARTTPMWAQPRALPEPSASPRRSLRRMGGEFTPRSKSGTDHVFPGTPDALLRLLGQDGRRSDELVEPIDLLGKQSALFQQTVEVNVAGGNRPRMPADFLG